MTRIPAMSATPDAAARRENLLVAGFRAHWTTLLLIAAINTGIALVLWIGEHDTRSYWHPFVTVQLNGFAIAYCINAAAPWDHDTPLRRLTAATLLGSLIGLVLVIVVKGYTLDYVRTMPGGFVFNVLASFVTGLSIGGFFHIKRREARAAAALHRAEAERHLLSRQAVEAELKLLQAQVEPHFLFNTLASVQYLVETDPKQANVLLGHLVGYLRAALPELRARSSTLGREIALAEAYLSILRMRIGPRLAFAVEVPQDLRDHAFPPNLLISLVENAIKHGVEPSADGGTVKLAAHRDGDAITVSVTDTGRGLVPQSGRVGEGVGLANVRERLAALYGPRGRFTLEPATPRGMRATLSVPFEQTVPA